MEKVIEISVVPRGNYGKILVSQGRGGASLPIKFSSNVQVDHWYLPIIMFYISIETGM